MDEIARKARVNKATIYYHIGNKKTLYKSVLRKFFGGVAEQLNKKVTAAMTVEEKIHAQVSTIAENICSSKHISPIIMREMAAGGPNMPEEILEIMGRIMGSLRCILEEGERGGEIRPVNPLVVHLMIVGALNFLASGAPILKKKKRMMISGKGISLSDPPAKIGEYVADLLLCGLKTGEPGRRRRASSGKP